MNKTLTHYATALLFAMVMISSASIVSAEESGIGISSNIGIYSQYVWRGAPQGDGQSSVQGDLGISESGATVSVWYATLGDVNQGNTMEYDFIIDYSGESSGMTYSMGTVRYNYTHSATPTATEYYIGFGAGPISFKTYYDKDSKNMWTDLAMDFETADYVFSANMGYDIPDIGDREIKVVTVALGKHIGSPDGFNIFPSVSYNYAMGSNETGNGGKGHQIVAGVNFSY